jgi:hypothetical protein
VSAVQPVFPPEPSSVVSAPDDTNAPSPPAATLGAITLVPASAPVDGSEVPIEIVTTTEIFDASSLIVWNGGFEDTLFRSANDLGFLLDTSTVHPDVPLPADIPVYVQVGDEVTDTATFTLEAPATREAAEAHKEAHATRGRHKAAKKAPKKASPRKKKSR